MLNADATVSIHMLKCYQYNEHMLVQCAQVYRSKRHYRLCIRENELRRCDCVHGKNNRINKIHLRRAVNWDNIVLPFCNFVRKKNISTQRDGCYFFFNSKASAVGTGTGRDYKVSYNNKIKTFNTQQDFSFRTKDFLVDIIFKMLSCIVCASLTYGLP